MQTLFGQTSRRVRRFITPLSTPRLQRIGGTLLGLTGSTLAGVIFGLALPVTPANAQVSANRLDGLRDNTPRWHAITGARIVVAPGKVIDNGTLVMRDGRITAVGADVVVPNGARVWKLDGRSVYAGFIDVASLVGVPTSMRPAQPTLPPWMRPPGAAAAAPAAATIPARSAISAQNRSVRADLDVATALDMKADEMKAAREQGFTTVLAAPAVGVFRGQSALVQLLDGVDAKSQVLQARVAQHASFDYERAFRADASYPNSMMGAIALARQSLYDARWYGSAKTGERGERVETNAALEALDAVVRGKQTLFYQADNEQDYQRVAKIRDEFNLRAALVGNGYEYRRAAQLKTLSMPMVVPLNFPAPPEIDNPDTAIDVPLDGLQHWEQAPSNLAYLHRTGVPFAVTARGLRDPKEFLPQLRLAVKRGLPADAALAALTTVPASMVGATTIGTLEVGKLANITVASGDIFTSDTAEVEVNFVDGKPHVSEAYQRFDARGTWSAMVAGKPVELKVAGSRARPTLTLDGLACEIATRARQVVIVLPCRKPPAPASSTTAPQAPSDSTVPAAGDKLTIVAEALGEGNNTLRGTAEALNGVQTTWTATRTAAFKEPTPRARPEEPTPALATSYPFGAYGISRPVKPANVLIKNATIWASGSKGAGRLERADMLVRDGKIAAVGASLAAPADAVVIDAAGKHVSPGIIDAHSHTAVIGGVNESTSSITAEVRIGDVVDATDINIYRQLAGGVTGANVLHGSANTIGGQSQTIKFRWGSDAEGLKFAGAQPGIKFALGENVKQANWGEGAGSRYPQTRMGVEQILRDGFSAARQYQKKWADYREKSGANPKVVAEPRRDLQLDTLVEILEKKRVVHIHSYRADEILMFVRVAQEYGFAVATFQHVLEGYKVADAMASIGAGGSTFSDWWAYKMEVYDAIPTNAALMHRAGVLTTLNSDSNELARRLNTEAAKVVRYSGTGGTGGVSEVEALKMVTTNAAKQLRIDDRTGSLEVGKDADFVIWNTSPLSTNARAEQTWIEGQKYFDLESDAKLRAAAIADKQRLLAKAQAARAARMAQAAAGAGVGAAAGRPMGAGAPTETSAEAGSMSVRDTLEFMAMQRWLHDTKQFRSNYWDGGAWHECTEDAK